MHIGICLVTNHTADLLGNSVTPASHLNSSLLPIWARDSCLTFFLPLILSHIGNGKGAPLGPFQVGVCGRNRLNKGPFRGNKKGGKYSYPIISEPERLTS